MRTFLGTVTIILTLVFSLIGCNRQETAHYQGYIEGEYLFLTSSYPGEITALPVERGELVQKGQLLFKLTANPEAAILAEVKSQYQQALNVLADMQKGERQPALDAIAAQIKQGDADLVLAQARLVRMQKLYARGATDQDSLQAAIAERDKLTATIAQYKANLSNITQISREDAIKAQKALVDAARAKVAAADWALNQKTIHAPLAARVYDTYYHLGEYVPAGHAVVSLLAPRYIHVIFFIPEPRLSSVQIGQTVTLNCDGCKKTYKARITYISSQTEYTPPVVYSRDNSYKLVYQVKARPLNPEFFNPGQPIDVSFEKRTPNER